MRHVLRIDPATRAFDIWAVAKSLEARLNKINDAGHIEDDEHAEVVRVVGVVAAMASELGSACADTVTLPIGHASMACEGGHG